MTSMVQHTDLPPFELGQVAHPAVLLLPAAIASPARYTASVLADALDVAIEPPVDAPPADPERSSATASGLPDAVPTTTGGDCDGDLPVPRWKASARARVCDDAGPARISRSRHGPSRLLLDGKHQRPELVLRRSIPSLRTPLSTLRLQPHDRTRINSGSVWLAAPSP